MQAPKSWIGHEFGYRCGLEEEKWLNNHEWNSKCGKGGGHKVMHEENILDERAKWEHRGGNDTVIGAEEEHEIGNREENGKEIKQMNGPGVDGEEQMMEIACPTWTDLTLLMK